jgi:hypothetical protein
MKGLAMKKLIMMALVASIFVLGGCEKKTVSNPEAEKAAVECSQAWLALIDAGKYAESWDEAAEYLRVAVGKEDFQKSLLPVMKPLGKMVSRKLKSKKYTTSLPGAPDGQYVIIQYDTSFENKKSAVETITPMLDKDGKWRVSGYYIK